MKKTVAFISLLITCVAMFAQSGPTFPYQAVVRNSQNQLIKDSTFAVDVAIYQGATLKYSETQSVTTNANGQFTMSIGGGTVVSGAMDDITDWSVAKFKVTCHLSGGDIVSENAVSPVPYALQAANATSGHFLTSDSAVITTMQSDIAALQAASLDCNDVKNCIADTLNAYTPTTQLCNAVKDCDFSGNTSIANLLQTLSDQIAAQNRVVDSLAHIVDSLSNITPSSPGGGDNTCCSELGARLDSLAHIVDSLSNLSPVPPVTPTDTFTCGTSKVKDVDGNEYNTVQIGNQCWTKENLRTKTHQYGQVWTKTDADSAIYGRYYDWQAAMQIEQGNSTSYTAGDKHRGICPAGWHVPSDAEWTQLTNYVKGKTEYQCDGNADNIAKALSSTTGWNSNTSEGCNAGNTGDKANATGFSAVPAGLCSSGGFSGFGGLAYVWSATQDGDYDAWCRILASNFSNVLSVNASKDSGFSVRCVRNAGVGGGDEPSEPDTPDTPTDTFNCGTDKVKDVQNNEYNTVQIGNQCWTKENLRTNVGTGDYGYPTGVSGTADTVTYGRLYSWAAVMNGASASSDVPSGVRGICPEGWHVPSDGEWGNLINYVKSKPNEYKCGDDANNIANALSSETGWTNSSTSGCNAGDGSEKRNQTGFSAVPAGYFGTNSTNKGTHTYFWSTTDSGNAVYYRHLDNTSSSMNSGFEFSENMGLSVRCLRN